MPGGARFSQYPAYDVNPDYIPFEHRGWHPTRMRVYRAMMETEQPPARVCRFLACGEEVHVYQEPVSGEISWRGTRCHDRFCQYCGQVRSHRIADAISHLLEQELPLFITLTVRGSPTDSLASLIEKLSNAWKGLRRLDYWRERIRGGAIMLEVKWSKTSGGHWHPHYHLLAHGKWIDRDWLRDAWRVLTRDSDQCDVQRVKEVGEALWYVTKYASKPMDGSFTSKPNLLREAMKTLKGRRLVTCFGTWHGTPLNEECDDEEPTQILTQWCYLGTRRLLEYRAANGSHEARDILARLGREQALRYALSKRCGGSSTHDPTSVIAGDIDSDRCAP